jgi:hypothetical protein
MLRQQYWSCTLSSAPSCLKRLWTIYDIKKCSSMNRKLMWPPFPQLETASTQAMHLTIWHLCIRLFDIVHVQEESFHEHWTEKEDSFRSIWRMMCTCYMTKLTWFKNTLKVINTDKWNYITQFPGYLRISHSQTKFMLRLQFTSKSRRKYKVPFLNISQHGIPFL